MQRSLSIAWGCWSDSKAEVFTLLRLAIPVSANYLLNRLVGFTSVLFVGRWGPGPMSAAALGLSLINVIGPGVLNGLTGGVVTLCGQVNRSNLTTNKLSKYTCMYYHQANASADCKSQDATDDLD